MPIPTAERGRLSPAFVIKVTIASADWVLQSIEVTSVLKGARYWVSSLLSPLFLVTTPIFVHGYLTAMCVRPSRGPYSYVIPLPLNTTQGSSSALNYMGYIYLTSGLGWVASPDCLVANRWPLGRTLQPPPVLAISQDFFI